MRKHIKTKRHNELGQEILDQTPVAVPMKYKKPATDFTSFSAQMSAMNRMAALSGFETMEEANDFDCPDEMFPIDAPWEENYEGQFEEDARMAKNPPRRKQKKAPAASQQEQPSADSKKASTPT